MNSEDHRNVLSADLQRYASKLIMKQEDKPKHSANTTKDFIRRKTWTVLDCPSQSPDHNQIEREFHLMKKRLKEPPRNKQDLKESALKVLKNMTNEECNNLVTSMGRRLHAGIASKCYVTK